MPDDAGPPPRAGVLARAGRSRTLDRRLSFGGLALAGGFMVLALGALALPPSTRLEAWLPLHLALAGGATTAIAALLPFFTAALTAAAPAPAGIRVSSIVLVAAGALAVAVGRTIGAPAVAANGGVVFIAGLVAVALAGALPLRGALGPRRRPVELAYGVALLEVIVGAGLATGYLGGIPVLGGAWTDLKPAHAWLNLFGFVALVIAATLIHLAPTVSGTLIRRRRSGILALGALAGGPPTVAVGYALEADAVVRAGAGLAALGAVALVAHGVAIWRSRGHWTSDLAWHRFAEGALVLAPVWLAIAASIAAVRVLVVGANPGGWELSAIVAPIVGGFVLQTLAGASTHLVPAVGPGHPVRHAAQRRLLGRGAVPRLVAWNAAVAVLTIALAAGDLQPPWAVVIPIACVVLAIAMTSTLALLIGAVSVDGSRT